MARFEVRMTGIRSDFRRVGEVVADTEVTAINEFVRQLYGPTAGIVREDAGSDDVWAGSVYTTTKRIQYRESPRCLFVANPIEPAGE